MQSPQPLFELTRGSIVESTHYGAIAVVNSHGHLIASYGDPHTVAFLRSSAKPFQTLPFVERGGLGTFSLSMRELALACASHEGSDMHVRAVEDIQAKVGIRESHLQCGSHLPGDADAYRALLETDNQPTPNRNNCSGKHAFMLAHARMRNLPLDNYLDFDHPIQQDILASFADLCLLPLNEIERGIDGCSAPNFAVSLYHAALGMARFCHPRDLPAPRAEACRTITKAMTSHPDMVSGPGEFDCELMKAGAGYILSKRGAEGYQIIGLLPGALGPGSPGVGIALKVSDGDLGQRRIDLHPYSRVRPAVTLEVLKQLDVLDEAVLESLSGFGPFKPVQNHRGMVVGESRPVFRLRIARN